MNPQPFPNTRTASTVVKSDRLFEKFPREYWREKCRDLFFFETVVLKSSCKEKFNNFGVLQRHLCEFMDPTKNKNRKLFISMFRGSFKTTVVLGWCLYMFVWAVVRGESLSIVYNTATKENATAFMEDFREIFTNCKFLHVLFPELPTEEKQFRSWHAYRVEYANVKFHVASLDTQQVGRHYQIIINDDLVNDKNAFSEVERENVRRKWALQKSILTKYSRLGIGTEIDVGTPYDKGDLIAHIIREVKGYDKFIVPYAVKNAEGRRVLTFPEIYTWEDFAEKRADMGESLFATQYALTVLDVADRIVYEKWIREWDVLPDNYQRYLIGDPAGTEKKRNDPWGFIVADLDERGRIHVRHVEESWMTPYAGLKHAEWLAQHYRTDENYFEKEKYSVSIADSSDRLAPNFVFGLIDHKNEPPEKRVRRLKQYFETGRILFGPGQELLKKEALYWPDYTTDHALMCLAHLVRVMQPPKKGLKRYDVDKTREFQDEIKEAVSRVNALRNGPAMDAIF